ncbi:MAG TPA: short-chain dehydrogenase [Microscillaceae bacterium]|nr:short-chain dehydrogenase [Microscillaceae bacterium]
MNTLENKVVVVTGASKGIGAAIAETIAQKGAQVVVNYHTDQSGATAVVERITQKGGKALAIQANVTQSKNVEQLLQQATQAFGKLDVLVNNAGVYQFEPLEAFTEAEYRRQFDHNVLSIMLTSQAAIQYFNSQGGSIINIGSVASIKATPASMIYSASKSAVDAITRVLSKELGAKKIRVNAILPGPTQTQGNQVAGTDMESFIVSNTPLGRIGQPEDIAKVVAFLASDEAFWITGQKIAVSGGFD